LVYQHTDEHILLSSPPLPPLRYDRGNFFPGTGAVHDVGSGRGAGYSINIPWDGGGLRDGDYIAAFSRM
jgi:histone deacetylase 6